MTVQPKSAEQWQEAVDAAHACLALSAARSYGLVEGGPDVDEDRCLEILEQGAACGFRPRADAIEAFVRLTAGAAR